MTEKFVRVEQDMFDNVLGVICDIEIFIGSDQDRQE